MNQRQISYKYIHSFLALVLLSATASAENCLWKASSERGTFYLQGSVHLLKASDYPLDPAIEEAYANSDTLIFETDITKMLTAESQQLLLQKAMLPAGKTLENELDPDLYATLEKKLAESGLPPEAMQQFKPWFALMTLMEVRMMAMGLNPNMGLDQYFHRKALADGKKEIGLETVEFQINLFDALSEGNQNAFAKHALKELEQIETMMDDMLGAWKKGNLDKLNALVKESFKDYPNLYEQFVTDRNKTWADKLDCMADKEKKYMVVVGAAHLAGKKGLLELLRAKGYSIEQL